MSESKSLQTLYLEDCGHLSKISGCNHLNHLTHVTISNVRDLCSLSELADAPNLKAVVVQLAPNLPIVELEWMLTHPTLENVYPLLEANTNSPLMERVRRLLAPRYGDDLFERPLDWMA